MSIAVIGHCRDDTERLAGRLHEYGLGHGCYIEFYPYWCEAQLLAELDSCCHTGVIITLPGADGLRLASRLREAQKNYRLTLLTDDKKAQCGSYRIPVTLCLERQLDEPEMALIYKKMIFANA